MSLTFAGKVNNNLFSKIFREIKEDYKLLDNLYPGAISFKKFAFENVYFVQCGYIIQFCIILGRFYCDNLALDICGC